MPLFHLVLVAVIQGITEFLPISSSGHLILLPNLSGMHDQGLVIDVAVHVGTLLAVMLYFWRDVAGLVAGMARLAQGRVDGPQAFLALCLVVATIPVAIAGGLIKLTGVDAAMRSTALIGWTMLGFGIVLWWFDQKGPVMRRAEEWTLRHALVMGLWQVLALIPGTSRSGITITGARALGYTRADGARLAMLMSIPTIIMAGLLLSLDMAAAGAGVMRDAGIAAAFAFVSALAALHVMMRLARVVSFTPYVIYRVLLGAGLLIYAYGFAA